MTFNSYRILNRIKLPDSGVKMEFSKNRRGPELFKTMVISEHPSV